MNVCTYSISNRTISAGTLSVFSQRLQKLNGCCFSVNSCDENNYLTDILLEKIVSYLKVNVKMVLRHLEQNIRPRANEMMEVKTTVCKKNQIILPIVQMLYCKLVVYELVSLVTKFVR